MKILCLHGAYGSASNFKVQLHPFLSAVEQNGVEFKWINGGHSVVPPAGFEDFFGLAPHFRFIDFDGIGEMDDMMNKIREMPQESTPEETIRKLIGNLESFSGRAVRSALDRLFEILEQDPEIDGILGYSEGAMVASTLILEEARRCAEQGKPRQIKYGIFFAGWPPLRLEGDEVRCLLADECENIIDVPTCHIVGCNDPYIHGAMALFSMCDEDTAILFDHGKGHTIPRDAQTLAELAVAVESTCKSTPVCV
ncbi:hypothetical protein DL546_002270 [Coniochaeta pulveracea]|uniref:Serine hydrolase domain-containing protein n=1 Tax=Coniochaeta pulveracea TaxID=177199 RepID=A0A420XYB7_9PEZI|nr:hypothetical protein DL546_002270 [Coniochaeta pulveracea]